MLAFLGAEVVLTPSAQGMKGAIASAEELVRITPNALMPQQFKNLAIPKSTAAPRRRKSGTTPAAISEVVGKTILAIVPSFSERYLSRVLFEGI